MTTSPAEQLPTTAYMCGLARQRSAAFLLHMACEATRNSSQATAKLANDTTIGHAEQAPTATFELAHQRSAASV
jgi:hypothetical protein